MLCKRCRIVPQQRRSGAPPETTRTVGCRPDRPKCQRCSPDENEAVVRVEEGRAAGYEDFATGWSDGLDDRADAIYRISWAGH